MSESGFTITVTADTRRLERGLARVSKAIRRMGYAFAKAHWWIDYRRWFMNSDGAALAALIEERWPSRAGKRRAAESLEGVLG